MTKLISYRGGCGRWRSHRIPLAAFAYIGDDVNDLPAIALAGLSACPSDAMVEVRRAGAGG